MKPHVMIAPLAFLLLLVPETQAQELVERAVFKGHTFPVQRVALGPDGKFLASGGGDTRGGELKLWEVATGKEIGPFSGYSNSLNALAFSHDGRLLASGDIEYRVLLWDVGTRKQQATFKGHTDWVHAVAFSPDGKTLALLNLNDPQGDIELRLLDVATSRVLLTHKGRGRSLMSLTFAPDGTLYVLGSLNDHTVRLWAVTSTRERQ